MNSVGGSAHGQKRGAFYVVLRQLRLYGQAAASDATGKKSRARDPTSKKNKPSFVPVQIEPSSQARASVEIVQDQPPRIKVTSGFDADLLREVVRVLESR